MRFRLLLLLIVFGASGCVPETAAPGAPARPAGEALPISICVVAGGDLVEVPAQVQVETGDALVGGRPLSQAHPVDHGYALPASWYVENEPFTYAGVCYLKYGTPRRRAPRDLRRVGEHHGVGLYAEADDTGERPQVIYVPVRPGCWFQTYQYELVLRPCHVRKAG